MHVVFPPFDLALARRLNRPGPRYTSYPTAAQFDGRFSSLQHLAVLAASGVHHRPLSLYVHIPFCEKLCHYCACHMRVTRNSARVDRYVDYLLREAELVAGLLHSPGEVIQVHWGGGTPNSLSPRQIRQVSRRLRRLFRHAPDVEMSFEADPRTLTLEHLEAAADAGFTRLSLGVQTFDLRVQEAIGRVQPFASVSEAVEGARFAGFEGVNFDLLYGLPHQTKATLAETVGQAVSLAPDRIALFGYAHVPWMKRHQQLIDAAALPTAEDRLSLYALAHELLALAGYEAVGLDHFALPDDPLVSALRDGTLHRNFQGYTTRAGADVVGLGVSSISSFPEAYAQNAKGLTDYYRLIDSERLPTERGTWLSREDRLRRDIIGRLMCGLSVEKGLIEAEHDIVFDNHFLRELEALTELEDLGVVALQPDRVEVTPEGRPFVRNVAMTFDTYLENEPHGERYSQTV